MLKNILLATVLTTALATPASAGHCPADAKAIDHALTTRSVAVRSVGRGPDAGSDHYPLEVTVICCGPDGSPGSD